MNARLFPLILCLMLGATALRADVKIRPGDKPKESTKDFIKDAKKNGYPTPEPRDRTFAFTEGLSVDIELEVATSYLGAVKFTIRDLPQHGRLSEIRSHPSGEGNKAMITYTHGGDAEQLTDRFTFQGKVGDGNTSSPGTITLFGKRSEPKLEVLEAPQFRRLQPGEQDAGRIVLLNSGTAPFKGEIRWPEPFIGPPQVELAINEKQTFLLMIKPMKPGAYRVSQELQPGVASSKVQAYVECVQPFVAQPSSVALLYDPVAGNRSGVARVSNASDAPLELTVDCAQRVKVARKLSIPPKTTQDVKIELDAADVLSFRGEVWFVQEPHREKIVVQAEPEPPQIKLESPANGKIDFGKLEKGKSGEARISLFNAGGAAAILKLTNVPPFVATAASASVIIEPGKSHSVVVGFIPEQPGTYNANYVIGGNAGKVEVALTGTMFDPKRPNAGTTAPAISNPNLVPTKAATSAANDPRSKAAAAKAKPTTPPPALPASLSIVPAKRATATEPTKAKPEAASTSPGGTPKVAFSEMSKSDVVMFGRLATFGFGAESLPQFQSKILDPVTSIGVSEAGRDYLVLTWTPPKVEPKEYLVQTSSLVPNKTTGLLLKSWKNVEGWKPVVGPGGTMAGKIEGLSPGMEYEWRVLGVDHEGKLSQSSDLIRVSTMPPFEMPFWFWVFILGAALAAGVIIYRRVQAQRALG